MTNKFKILPGILMLALSLPVFAGSPSVSASDMSRIKELRASGESLHKSGNHADSVAALHEAMKLLGI